jgi:hypothetical protein
LGGRQTAREWLHMKRVLRWVCGFLLIVGVALHTPAHASLVEAVDLETLVAEAEQVVLARVIGRQSYFDDHGRIVTDVTMQVEESIKGNHAVGAAIVVQRLGGVVDDIGMRVAGEPDFTVGETVILFGARATPDAALRPIGMAQGALRVFEKDGERWARAANSGITTVKRKAGRLERAEAALPAPRRLAELLPQLHALAKSSARHP